ncbi:CxC2 domain-containing protein [Mycena kentingensis (nom. inval.)]|nr:CxC2 domain-containing protein [Mycena kentingensis (nom. inval.)]
MASRREKRRAQEVEGLLDNTASFRRPNAQRNRHTVTSDAGTSTNIFSLPIPQQSHDPLVTHPSPASVSESVPAADATLSKSPSPPPPPSQAPKRRVQMLDDFEVHFEEIGDLLLEHNAHPQPNAPCSCGRAYLANTMCRECTDYAPACSLCFVERHHCNPLHWAEVWDAQRSFFVRHDMSTLDIVLDPARKPNVTGAAIQLGHHGAACPTPVGERMFTLSSTPMASIRRLLRAGFFPASTREPITAFTLRVLREFQLHTLEAKKAAYDYVKALRRLSDDTFAADVPDPYTAFLRVVRIYNFLTLKQRAGQLHRIDEVLTHRPAGNVVPYCPACPEPGFNSDPVCTTTPIELRHLNQIQRTLDGNFQERAISLSAEYRDYLGKVPVSKEKSTCSYLSVVNKQDKKKFKNMAITGTINAQCSHVFVLSCVDMHHGERFANADMALAMELRKWTGGAFKLSLKLEVDDVDQVETYDIACEYTIHLRERFATYFPELLPLVERIRWGIPALHVQGHQESCTYMFGTSYMECVGHFHGESAEQYWPEANQLGAHSRQMNLGHRHDTLIFHHADWNRKKEAALAATLSDDGELANSNYEKKFQHLVGLSISFRANLDEWRAMDRTPRLVGKEVTSVYKHRSSKVPSQQTIFQKLIKDEAAFARTTVAKGKVANFIDTALKIQDAQRRLVSLIADRNEHDLVSRQKEIDNRTKKLQAQTTDWRKLQKQIMPAVADAVAAQAREAPSLQDEKLFIPSDFSASDRVQLDLDDLAAEEARWREGQIFDTIRALQNNVKATTAMRGDKAKNDRHQKANTRAVDRIRVSLSLCELHKASYHVARTALITLTGSTRFPVLEDADLYMKPVMDKRRVGDSKLSDGALWRILAPPEEEDISMEVDEEDSRELALSASASVSGTQMAGRKTGTRRTYSTGQRSFINHVKLHALYNADGSVLPATQPAVMSWIASLAGRVQPKTIKAYLSAVRSLHVDADLPFSICESPLVQRLIRGIKRFYGERDRKPVQPITRNILIDVLGQLRRDDVPGHTTFYVNLTLPASKTDPFRKGVTITIAAAPGQPSCPVAALKRLWSDVPRDGSAALFEGLDGKPLKYGTFVSGLRDALIRAGYDPTLFAGHSFRRGAASEAAAAGYNDYEIQLLGCWRSDSYKLYIENPLSRILHLSQHLHMAHSHSIPFEPPALRDYTTLA